MKTLKILSISIVAILVTFTVACNKKNNVQDLSSEISGIYTGTLKSNNQKNVSDAVADISESGDNQIEIHCYGNDIDTTFVQRLFDDGDTIQMCSVGDAFYNEYGHQMTNQSEHHDMMKDSEGMSWAHHMDEEHDENDEHYGFFNLSEGTFSYTFNLMSGGVAYTAIFNGTKK
ncbi:MAG: hypothetical protein L3J56_07505 [Bacteroidales bacterium]|nr:hypothetical protein [Bacteroidales bacterium]